MQKLCGIWNGCSCRAAATVAVTVAVAGELGFASAVYWTRESGECNAWVTFWGFQLFFGTFILTF